MSSITPKDFSVVIGDKSITIKTKNKQNKQRTNLLVKRVLKALEQY